MLKTYETIGTLNRMIALMVDGKRFDADFKNGVLSPRKIQGRYSTANPLIQKALESSPSFGVRYRLVGTFKSADDEPIIPERVTSDPVTGVPLFDNPDIIDEELPMDDPDDDFARLKIEASAPVQSADEAEDDMAHASIPDVTVVGDEVTNAQKGRAYLMQHYQIRFAELPNTDAIIRKAKELNVNFEKWEAFK